MIARSYQVKRLNPLQEEWWKEARTARVDLFPWGAAIEDDYRPVTNARLGTDGESLFVFMETNEKKLRIETKGFGHVHMDSCMEFFVSPDPVSPKYLNFEFNPAGAMYLSIGTSRYDRSVLAIEKHEELFQVRTTIHSEGWNLEYHIPLSFLERFFPSLKFNPGHPMRGNFYKCGEKTSRPHFGCWSPIDLPKPDFHCPDFFGTLVLM